MKELATLLMPTIHLKSRCRAAVDVAFAGIGGGSGGSVDGGTAA